MRQHAVITVRQADSSVAKFGTGLCLSADFALTAVTMSLPAPRLARFARHIVLPEIGGAGQVALAGAHIAMIGCGGIGSPALQYLAAAGIGGLTLIDDDVV